MGARTGFELEAGRLDWDGVAGSAGTEWSYCGAAVRALELSEAVSPVAREFLASVEGAEVGLAEREPFEAEK